MSDPTIATDWTGFKAMAAELLRAEPDLDDDGLDNGIKCLNLAFLGATMSDLERYQAKIVLDIAQRRLLARDPIVQRGEAAMRNLKAFAESLA